MSDRKIPKPISCLSGSFDAEAAVRYPHLIDPDWLSQNENWIDAYPEYKHRYLIAKLASEYQAYRCPPKDALCSGASYPIPYPATLLSGSWSLVKAANNPDLIDPNWLASNPHWIEDYEELKLSWGEALHKLNNSPLPLEIDPDWLEKNPELKVSHPSSKVMKEAASHFEPLTCNRFYMSIEGLEPYRVRNILFSKKRMIAHVYFGDKGFSLAPSAKAAVQAELKILNSTGDVAGSLKFKLKRTDVALGEHDFGSQGLLDQDAHFSFRYDKQEWVTMSLFFDIVDEIEYVSPS